MSASWKRFPWAFKGGRCCHQRRLDPPERHRGRLDGHQKGDILAVLDASDYEEMVITQQMNVDRAKAEHRTAELQLDVARLAIEEYRDGTQVQMTKSMSGQIALAQSDLERAITAGLTGRSGWSSKGVSRSLGQVQHARSSSWLCARSSNSRQALVGLNVFHRNFSQAPMWLKILDSDVKGSEAMLTLPGSPWQRNIERLEHLKSQVELCTIPRARTTASSSTPTRRCALSGSRPGIHGIRQSQRLFYLPDLSKMEVATLLHESVAREVKAGMRTRIRIEALAGRELEGHVVAISQLPTQNNFFSDIKYFTATVQLDTIPQGLRPGMSAEVEIETLHRHDVLTIPTESLTRDQGHDVCYVALDDHLVRREVKLGQATRDFLEITEGLTEGESIVLDPGQIVDDVDVEASSDLLADEPILSDSQATAWVSEPIPTH